MPRVHATAIAPPPLSIGIPHFLRVGRALLEIRDCKLYRQYSQTFERYLEDKWQMSRGHGYRLISAAEIAKDLPAPGGEEMSPTGDNSSRAEPPTKSKPLPPPRNERQLRPLSKVPQDQRRKVWEEATQLARMNGRNEPSPSEVKAAAKPVVRKAERDAIQDAARRRAAIPEPTDDPVEDATRLRIFFEADDQNIELAQALVAAENRKQEHLDRQEVAESVSPGLREFLEDLRILVDAARQLWPRHCFALLPASLRELADEIEAKLDGEWAEPWSGDDDDA